jgi:adenylate cyclase
VGPLTSDGENTGDPAGTHPADGAPDSSSISVAAEWEQAGLYEPAHPQAEERRALLELLTRRGATVEQMVEAHAMGALPGLAGNLVIRPSAVTVPVRVIAERRGVPIPRVLRVLQAAGIPATEDDEVSEDLADLMSAFEQGAAVMGEDAILAFTRVLGASAMSIAEAAVALFFAEFGPGMAREGPDELARARVSEAATAAFVEVPAVLGQMVMDQFERAQRRIETARGWAAVRADHVTDGDGPVEVVALGFVDLVGSTRWSHTIGLREQSLALTRFESAAWSSAVQTGGRVIKTIGDEVFFVAPTVDAACHIGMDVIGAAHEDSVLPQARGAVGLGPVTPREGDYYGPLVNLLSRLVKVGQPGDLVVTAAAKAELPHGAWSVEALEPAELRGVEGPVESFRAAPRPMGAQGPGSASPASPIIGTD